MRHKRAVAYRKRMHIGDGQIPHVGGARYTAHRYDHRGAAIRPPHRLTHVEEAGDQPAVIGAEPGMVGGGVDDFGMGACPGWRLLPSAPLSPRIKPRSVRHKPRNT
jgi:hypothetical protein